MKLNKSLKHNRSSIKTRGLGTRSVSRKLVVELDAKIVKECWSTKGNWFKICIKEEDGLTDMHNMQWKPLQIKCNVIFSRYIFFYCNFFLLWCINVTEWWRWTGPLVCLSLSSVTSWIRSDASIWQPVFPFLVLLNKVADGRVRVKCKL